MWIKFLLEAFTRVFHPTVLGRDCGENLVEAITRDYVNTVMTGDGGLVSPLQPVLTVI